VDAKFIHPLKVDSLHVIDGIRMQMLKANHGPGVALIYFGLKDGRHILHAGDFRACEEMQSYPVLRNAWHHMSGPFNSDEWKTGPFCLQIYHNPL
jgi:DNA cross-link repair 1A protein